MPSVVLMFHIQRQSYGFKPLEVNALLLKKPKTVRKYGQIQCKPHQNGKIPPQISGYAPVYVCMQECIQLSSTDACTYVSMNFMDIIHVCMYVMQVSKHTCMYVCTDVGLCMHAKYMHASILSIHV